MSTSLRIFSRIYIKTFYRDNASFFLVIVAIAGGFMSSVEHKALAEFFVSSPIATLIPVILWVFYGFKVVTYNTNTTHRKENEFLSCHSLFPSSQQYLNVVFVLVNQLAPAILYGAFIAVTAVKYNGWLELVIVIAGLVLILTISASHLKHLLSHPNAEKKVSLIDRLLNKHFVRPYPMFVIEWIARKKTFLLLSTMTFCCVFLFGVLMLYTTDTYDFRLLQMALIIIVSGNIQLIQEMHRFETFHFSTINQLPFSLVKRMGYLVPVFIFISLPQMALLLRYFPDNLSWLILIEYVAFILGYSFFLYGMQYQSQLTQDKIMRNVFALALVLFVLTLFSIPVSLITVLSTLGGIFVWRRNFYAYEVLSEKGNTKTL